MKGKHTKQRESLKNKGNELKSAQPGVGISPLVPQHDNSDSSPTLNELNKKSCGFESPTLTESDKKDLKESSSTLNKLIPTHTNEECGSEECYLHGKAHKHGDGWCYDRNCGYAHAYGCPCCPGGEE